MPLSDAKRADLYEGLCRLLGAGLPMARSLESVAGSTDFRLDVSLRRAAQSVGQGTSLVSALSRERIANERDLALLRAAELAGRIEAAFEDLAERYRSRARRARNMKAKMMYPAAVIGIVVFVAPVPALFDGAIGAGGYVLRTFLPLLLAVFAIRSGKHLWMRARDRGYPESLALFVLRLPLVGTLIRLRERVDMLGALASLLASGVAAHEAFDQSARLVRNPVLRAACKRSLVRLKLGASVADALLEAEILNVNVGYPLISTGEAAGRLDEALLAQSRRDDDALESSLDDVATWLPRLFYFVALGVTAGSVLS